MHLWCKVSMVDCGFESSSDQTKDYKIGVFSGHSGFLTNKTDGHDITEILLKVALNTIPIKLVFVASQLSM
jgi:hypothetical protein